MIYQIYHHHQFHQLYTSDNSASTQRSQRTIATSTDDDFNAQYITRETLERQLQHLFQNLYRIQFQISQTSLPSYDQRLKEARHELQVLEIGLGRAKNIKLLLKLPVLILSMQPTILLL